MLLSVCLDFLRIAVRPDLWTNREGVELALHIIVILISTAAFYGGLLVGLFYVCKSAYARLRHMRLEQ
jgi:hypothetical protein